MKKILITAYSLDLGGIEKAILNMINNLLSEEYDITLILEKKEGIFLSQLPPNIEILEYKISSDKNTIIRKIKNRIKLMQWKRKFKNQYDFSCSFATHSIPGAHLALAASKNNAIWMHGNYYITYKERMCNFLDSVQTRKFKRVVFVSKENLKDVNKHYSGIKEKSIVCNNFIDGRNILEKSKDKIKYKKNKEIVFVNIGRHDEYQKRLTRIIKATKKLKTEAYKFKILFIGSGPDTSMYKKMVEKEKLSDYIIFMGQQTNPYPYFKLADAVILSSEYEGYPVVFLESMVMNKPIISTKVSDYESLIDKYGIFIDKTDKDVYIGMKQFLDNKFKVKEKFNYEKFNLEIKQKIIDMIEDNDKQEGI